ncbi:MAG TPA: ABC transporter ATP-binding protein [Puia sp.]|nr:ABC transporter ATP-binding protein [Puia sp.]
MNLLKVEGIGRKEGKDWIIKDIDFIQEKFQKIALAGATGSGKTTLLKIIAGLVQADAGEVRFENKRVTGPAEQLIPGFPGIAYLSQHFELRNNYRVEEILEYANHLSKQQAATLYEVCRIDHLLKRRTDQLSGGERQRIALARLLTASPRLLLLDEPFSNLDPSHKNNLKSVIRDIGERLSITCMMASHDPQDTLSWADLILVLEQGRLLQQGTPQEIYRQPVNEYVAGLFGKINVLGGGRLVRPEDIMISRRRGEGVEGRIEQLSFAGSRYEIEVSLPGMQLTVYEHSGHYQPGDTVYLSFGR